MDLKKQEEFYKKVVNDQLKYQYDMKIRALESDESESEISEAPKRMLTTSSQLSGKSGIGSPNKAPI